MDNGNLKKILWTFNWKEGGYNQVYALTQAEALQAVDREFGDKATGIRDARWNSDNVTNLRIADSESYWNSFPELEY